MEEWLYSPVFFTTALVGDEWSASLPSHVNPRGKRPSTHWLGGGMTPEPVGRYGEVKILDPDRASKFDPKVVEPVASCYTYCGS
jgi:hypothetical protein